MNTELLHHYEQYLLLEQGLSPNTREAYTRDLRRFLDYAHSRGVDALDVDLPLLEDYVHSLFEAGIAARSLARMISSVRSFYRYLQIEGYMGHDPTELLTTPRLPKHLPEVLTLEEVERILASLDLSTPEGLRDHCLIELLYSCGLRVSEVCALRLSDLFFDEGFVRVIGKGNKQRVVPISPRAVHEIRNWLDARAGIAVKPEDEDVLFVSARRHRQNGFAPHFPPHLRHPPARGRRLLARHPGYARPRGHRHHRNLHPSRHRLPARTGARALPAQPPRRRLDRRGARRAPSVKSHRVKVVDLRCAKRHHPLYACTNEDRTIRENRTMRVENNIIKKIRPLPPKPPFP